MSEYLTAPGNAIFLFALALFGLMFVIELGSALLGFGVFDFLDDMMPEPHLDVTIESPGVLESVFSFLRLGRVPLAMTITVFLFAFAFIGFNLQHFMAQTGIGRLHWLPASGIALLASLPVIRIGNSILSRILPKDETSAISSDSYIGRVAEVTLGDATYERQAEAKLVGPDNKTHHIQVVADNEDDRFTRGDHVLVVGRRREGLFNVIAVENPLLEN